MSSGVFGKVFGKEAVKKASELAVNKTVILKDGTKATIKSVIKAPDQPSGTRYFVESKDGNRQLTVSADDIKMGAGRPARDRQVVKDKNIDVPNNVKMARRIEGFKKLIDQGQVNTTDDVRRIYPGEQNKQFRNFIYKNYGAISENTINSGKALKRSPSAAQKQKKIALEQKRERQKEVIYEKPTTIKEKRVQGMSKVQQAAQDAADRVRAAKERFDKRRGLARGGVVKASNGVFIEVQNRFSDRMLPGKKRTTRIY